MTIRGSPVPSVCAGILAVACAAGGASAQCYGIWAQVELGHQTGHAMVYDSLRKRIVLHCAGTTAGAVGGTFSWDGQKWTHLTWNGPWPLRTQFGMAYDQKRDRVVLFGGKSIASGTPWLGDTWEFDGASWRYVASDGPPARLSAGRLTYDESRAQVVMFGRPTPSAWDGLRWTPIGDVGYPPAGPIAYDSQRDRIVLVSDEVTGDTWQFVNGKWSLITNDGPVGIAPGTLTYDRSRDRMVIFTGPSACGDQVLSEFDGTNWTHVSLPSDFIRTGEAMTYDSDLATPIMFGGLLPSNAPCSERPNPDFYSDLQMWDGATFHKWPGVRPGWNDWAALSFHAASGRLVYMPGYRSQKIQTTVYKFFPGDTWTWDATGWSNIAQSFSPHERYGTSMAYEESQGRTILFGGEYWGVAGPVQYRDTQAFSGSWSQLSSSGPPASYGVSLAYDPLRQRVVLIVGGGSLQTWELEGNAWVRKTPTSDTPSNRYFSAMAFDPNTGKILMFGGASIPSGSGRNDMWTWDGSAWVQISPPSPIPGTRRYHAMATDTARGVVMMMGGLVSPNGSDTWEWNGVKWKKVGDFGPTNNTVCPAAYDSANGVMYMHALGALWRWVEPQPPVFVESPPNTVSTVNRPVVIECLTESVGPATLRWRRDGAPLTDDGRIRGSQTMRLVIESARFDDAGSYNVECMSACGTVASQPGILSVLCAADVNLDSFVSGDDFDLFVGWFVAGSAAADFNGDGSVNGEDFDWFSSAFVDGC